MYSYGHYCIPVTEKPADADFVPLLGVYVTDCAKHPLSFEFLYVPEENKTFPQELRTRNHIAFNVDNFDEILASGRVLLQFICPYDNVSRVAFVEREGTIVEIKETTFA